jgi:hypothetical protein
MKTLFIDKDNVLIFLGVYKIIQKKDNYEYLSFCPFECTFSLLSDE